MSQENTEKLLTLSEIEELKTIAENQCNSGKYNEAIKTTLKIIEIAEKSHLYSIAREQGIYVAEIYKKIQDKNKLSLIKNEFRNLRDNFTTLIESKQIKEAHNLIKIFKENFEIYELISIDEIKEFLQKEDKIWKEYRESEYKIKTQLDPLEIQFNSYLKTNNLLLAGETLEKAKSLLAELKEPELLKSWNDYNSKYIKLKLGRKIEDSLKKVSELTDSYKFDIANSILDLLLSQVINNNFLEFKQKLETKKKNIADAETKYHKLEADIANLEKEVQECVSENNFQEAIDNINQIIKISRFIGKAQFLDKYTQYIEEIEDKINFIKKSEDTSIYIKNLNFEGIQAITTEDFLLAIEKYEEIIKILKNIV